jgi:4-hydroxy-tetrahydrodipicolinate reductase
MRKYKVIQWSTGNVGAYALRAIINHPDLELVGVVVHSEEKAGCDAAELCGLEQPTGVIATRDYESLLRDSGADCCCYTAGAEDRMPEALADMEKILRSGINVVSSSMVMLVYPECPIPEFIDPLKAACQKHKVSFLTSGIDPGFATDIMPLMFTGLSEHWSSIRMQEIVNYATYEQANTVRDVMGFGYPLDHDCFLLQPGVLSMAWGGAIRSVAAGVGLELDDIQESFERLPAERDIETTVGVIKQGSCAALRFEVKGYVDGNTPIVLEHVTRMCEDIAPHWPQGKGYKVIIEGEPRMEIEMDMRDKHGDHAVGGVIQTATRLVNAIPSVVTHAPGMMSALDLPMITGKGLYRPKVET